MRARRVWDSRGRPTVEAEVVVKGGAWGRAIAPAGASTGAGEAKDLRDGDAVLGGLNVRRALGNVNGEIRTALLGLNVAAQAEIDARLIALDGTPDKSRLGGNASSRFRWPARTPPRRRRRSRSGAIWPASAHVALPVPQIQIFGGGAHARGRVDVQDFLVVCPGAGSFAEALEWTAEVYRGRRRAPGEKGHAAGRRRRRRLLARVPLQRGRSRRARRRDRGRGPQARP